MIKLVAESVPIPEPRISENGSVNGAGISGAVMVYDLIEEGSIPFSISYGTATEGSLGLRRAILGGNFGPGDRAYLTDLQSGLVIRFVGTEPE